MSQPPVQNAAHPALIVTGGPLEGTVLSLDSASPRVVGSGPDCHLRLASENVAAVHARVSWDGQRLLLTDAGSAPGTFVNGEKAAGAQILRDGDRVSLGPPGAKGSVKLLVRLPAGAAAAASADPDIIVLDMDEPAEPGPARAAEAAAAPVPRPASPDPPPPLASARPATERPKPEYTMDIPSIVDDRARSRPELPPALEGAPRTRPQTKVATRAFTLPAIPRALIVGGVAAVVVLAGLLGYLWLRPPRPILASVSPGKVEPGQTVSLSGTGFDSSAPGNTVRIGTETGQVTSASDAQLTVVVPPSMSGAGDLQVTVETRGGTSNALFLGVYRGPRVTAVVPDVALPGEEVTLRGQNLAGDGLSVTFGGVPGDVTSAQPGVLKVKVPAIPMVEGQPVNLQVRVGGELGPPVKLILGRLPLVAEVVPASGRAGDRVTLKGRGFDADPAGNLVSFGNDRAMVLSASANELTVVAPASSTPGSQVEGPVVVRARGRTSSAGRSFTILRPSAAAFTPRYFPAFVSDHPSHDHAFVATELGPAFLLSGKADASSTVERAAKTCTALNALVESAGTSARVEARGPSVALVGGDVLLTATVQDAAGYAEGWGTDASRARTSPQALAGFWTAMLRDHLTLFIERQRPHHVLEMSPRGKVLLDIYAAAVRQVGAGNGVPPGMVCPLPASHAKALRDMALLLPAPGQATAAAAVTGSWEGTMEERGTGTRTIRVRLRTEGGRLLGSFATRSGSLTMDVPLKSVSYDRGVLTFVVATSGGTRRFKGAVQGASLDGTVHEDGRGGDALGRFTLRYVE